MAEIPPPVQPIGIEMKLRKLELPAQTSQMYDDFVAGIDARIRRGDDRSDICRDALMRLWGHPQGDPLLQAQMDPRNITLEAEYYGDCDPARFAAVKPLLWLWYSFDRSPAGMNLELGIRLRRMLAGHIFKRVGANFKCFPYVEFTFGYNMEVGDNVVVHRWVLLDDRAGIVLGDRASVSDFVNIYSHTHDINLQQFVDNKVTRIGARCRLTYHSTVLAGAQMGENSMLGAHGLLTRNAREHAVYVGIPAKKVKEKDRELAAPVKHPQQKM
ncbi:MAG: acyltransferase [Planctomycetes bacterium]|nr:acyltransferase [Planctomycetota bacterium]